MFLNICKSAPIIPHKSVSYKKDIINKKKTFIQKSMITYEI